nr:MAG TPA: hypothetical protein [Caudoviricetes sp.]
MQGNFSTARRCPVVFFCALLETEILVITGGLPVRQC